ncbi:hypothetical protein K440DRAFT_131739 [Wilcoxina mikolae CBS 423.85]|nr:hypothetical protein K440DRAFT_131739 [Wilcoxina mikolae CBS 423.85]
MASVPPRRCNVCNIWIDSAAHWGSQSHIAMSKRKYSDPHDRGHRKPYHSPETPSSSTTTPGTRTIPQPQSTISQPRSSSGPNSIAPQYTRTDTSISRTQRTPSSSNIAPATRSNSQPRFGTGSSSSPPTAPPNETSTSSPKQPIPPSAPQGFDDANFRSHRSSHHRGTPPTQPAPSTNSPVRQNSNRTNPQRQSNPAPSRPPALDPSTSPQYTRTDPSTSRIVAPAAPQGFNPAGLRSPRSSHQRGTPPAPPNTSTGTRNNNNPNIQPQSSPGSSRSPTSTAPQYTQTDPSTSRTQRTIPQPASSHQPEYDPPSTSDPPFSIPPPTTGPQGSFCVPCSTYIPFPAITSHLSPPTHTASCKTHGLFCIPCQKPFLNSFALSAHREAAEAHKVDPRLEEARREVGLYCEDCGETFQTRLLLRIHERGERHRGGKGSGGGGGFESQSIPEAAKVLGVRCEPAEQSIEESAIPATNTSARDEKVLFCHDCRCAFGTPAGLWFHHCSLPSSPGPYACPTCPRSFRIKLQQAMHTRLCAPLSHAPKHSFCLACSVEVALGEVAGHRETEGHQEKCKEVGLYCWVCEVGFLGAAGFQVHRLFDGGHRGAVKRWGRGGGFCTVSLRGREKEAMRRSQGR